MIHVLYVDREGGVRSGYLTEGSAEGAVEVAVVARTGRLLGPEDVLAVLALSRPTEAQQAAFSRAGSVGFRVESV